MIRLDVKDYCQKCRDFEPTVNQLNSLTDNIFIVRCEFRDKCETIEQYLKAKEEESTQ